MASTNGWPAAAHTILLYVWHTSARCNGCFCIPSGAARVAIAADAGDGVSVATMDTTYTAVAVHATNTHTRTSLDAAGHDIIANVPRTILLIFLHVMIPRRRLRMLDIRMTRLLYRLLLRRRLTMRMVLRIRLV